MPCHDWLSALRVADAVPGSRSELKMMLRAGSAPSRLVPVLVWVWAWAWLGSRSWSLAEARDSDLSFVTCGSLVKLLNTRHNVRLHSHDVKYGSGSGQQSVTGVDAADDANSYWQIRGKSGRPCSRGAPVKCGQHIRITHMKTGRNLHSHHFSSPLSNNQEVSAFGERGEGDDLDVWSVQCDGTNWDRDDSVRFKHVGTDVFLSVTGETYGHPIRGQREVHGQATPTLHSNWKTMEGVFIQPSSESQRGHDEL